MGRIVKEHGQHGVGAQLGLRRRGRDDCAFARAAVPSASVRFHTDNSWPAAISRSAIGVPILPNPRNPIFMRRL